MKHGSNSPDRQGSHSLAYKCISETSQCLSPSQMRLATRQDLNTNANIIKRMEAWGLRIHFSIHFRICYFPSCTFSAARSLRINFLVWCRKENNMLRGIRKTLNVFTRLQDEVFSQNSRFIVIACKHLQIYSWFLQQWKKSWLSVFFFILMPSLVLSVVLLQVYCMSQEALEFICIEWKFLQTALVK